MAKRITLVYIIVGCTWIFAGDYLLGFFITQKQLSALQILYLSIAKGIGYVLLTGLVLFLYLRRSFNNLTSLEKKYRTLFEENPNPMWVYDPETFKFLAVNKCTQLAYGYTEEEMLKITLRDIRPKEDIPLLEKQVANINRGIINSGVYRHKRKNGDVFFVNIYSGPTTFGKINARLVLALDVSEKEIAEQQIIKLNDDLSAFKLRLNNILSTVNDVVWSCSADTFTINYVSEASIKTFGYKPEEFYENSNLWVEIKHPDDRQRDANIRAVILKNGSFENEYRITTRSGQTRVIYDKSVVQHDENGNPTEVLGIATDITQLRESEQKLKSYSERIAHILDGLTDGFITLDKEWRFTFINKVFLTISKKTKEELLGTLIWNIFPELKDTLFFTHLNRAVTENESLHFEEQYFDDKRWHRCNIYPNVDGLAVYFTDVTHTHEMQQEIMRTKNNLNAVINNTDDIIWSLNSSYELTTFNTAYEKFISRLMNGHIPKVGDKTLFKNLPGNLPLRWESFYARVFAGESFSAEEKYVIPGIDDMYYEINFNPIYNTEGTIIGAACFAHEITQRKIHLLQVEEQNKKLMEISWMQSHEVRAPLSSIMGLISLFNRNNPSDPKNIQVLELMDVATKKLDDVVREIVAKSNKARLENEEIIGSINKLPAND
jgi:PAS domain S-box-containing protein